MQTVIIGHNPLQVETWTKHETNDIRELLMQEFEAWPQHARIYHGQVAQANDVTPHNEAEVERLGELEGLFYVVNYPGDPITAIIAVVAVVASAAVGFLFMPSLPTLKNTQTQSPNNALADRTNQPRPGGRIPDIYGQVRSTLDLLAVPYKVFQDHKEVEVSYMCIGKGDYEIDQILDDTTPVEQIEGTSVEVYGPGTSPLSGDAPIVLVGEPITYPLVSAKRYNSVNGQVLEPGNANNLIGSDDIRFVYPNVIETNNPELDFTQYFAGADDIIISGAVVETDPAGGVERTETTMRFESGGVIRFQTLNPTTKFVVGDDVELESATFAGDNAGNTTLVFDPPVFPGSHPAVLDRIKMLKLFGADPNKFYRVYHLFHKDIGTRAALWVYQSNDAAGTGSVAVAAWSVDPVSATGYTTVTLAQQGGSGITGEAIVDFGDGTASFATYNGAYADNGLLNAVELDGGALFVNLAGTYEIAALSATTVTLVSPATVNADWNNLAFFANDRTEYKISVINKIDTTSASIDLSGTYVTGTVSPTAITLVNPATVNPDWADLDDLPDNASAYISPVLYTDGPTSVGPVFLNVDNLNMVIANFVALQGLYKDDGKKQYPFNVTIQLTLTPVNASNVPIGPAENFTATIVGAKDDRSTRAVTMYAQPTFTGRCRATAQRLTPHDTAFKGTVVDEVKWRDVYAIAPVEQTDFGNVTTVFAVTLGTEGALSVKDRKLNMLATRKVPVRQEDGTFSSELLPTKNAADIMVAMALEPYIGNRTINELDIDNIYETVAAIEEYFGTPEAAEFCYTFDKDNISFEETLATLAAAIFSLSYRRGSIIGLFFEKETDDSSILFNHRNKLPGSETRTVTFGRKNDYDGVEYQFVDPVDDAVVTYFIPEDRSAVNPKKIESIGVRNFHQAYFAAWRAWNRIVYQNVTTEFDATQEADLLIVQERILVADNTRPETQDGQVEAQDGLELTLSQPWTAEDGVEYTIFLQHIDGTVESLPVVPGADAYKAVLGEAPRAALSLDPENFAVATYQIVGNNEPRGTAFLLAEKLPKSNFTLSCKAINYDARYYAKDKDLINEVID